MNLPSIPTGTEPSPLLAWAFGLVVLLFVLSVVIPALLKLAWVLLVLAAIWYAYDRFRPRPR